MDQQTAAQLKRKVARDFREQLVIGAPTNEDEAGLRRLSAQLRARKLVVKVHLRYLLHAKLYLAFKAHDADNPITGYLGSSNLTLAGLAKQGELNVDVLDHDACQKLRAWFDARWAERLCWDISDELADIIDESWARPEPIPPWHIYLKMAYHLSQDAREGLAEFSIPPDFRGVLLPFQEAAVRIAAQLQPDDVIEALPDIDFNIQTGNTLVGFMTLDDARTVASKPTPGQMRMFDSDTEAALREIEASAGELEGLLGLFRKQQTALGMPADIYNAVKPEIRRRLAALSTTLNAYLASDAGIDSILIPDERTRWEKYQTWLRDALPFHWFIAFHRVLANGGFNVIIGNPPYVAARNVGYLPEEMTRTGFTDIYAHVLMRTLALAHRNGRFGMIVPLSLTFSEDFGDLRTALCGAGSAWFSSYDNIPAALFSGVSQRCTIWIGRKSKQRTFVAPMHGWRATYRDYLLNNVAYTEAPAVDVGTFGIPKASDSELVRLLTLHKTRAVPGVRWMPKDRRAGLPLWFSPSARNFMSLFTVPPPTLDVQTLVPASSKAPGRLQFQTDDSRYVALCLASGEIYFWYWLVRGDGFDVTSWILADYLMALNALADRDVRLLAALGDLLSQRRFEALVFKKNAGKYVGNFNYRGMYEITRRGDLLFMAGLGVDRATALSVFNYVQRVLAINESAGEKAIPAEVKAKFPPLAVDAARQAGLFCEVDRVLAAHYGFTDEELDSIINYDIKYRMGRDAADGDGE